MKKFLITLFILIALAGTIFFFGWVTFAVPPGAYGVITSKTHGIDPQLVQSAQFRWVWYRLIPTNVKISVFRLDQKQFPVDYDSTLPSGDIYAQFVGLGNADFSYKLKGDIFLAINPDYLVNLATANNLENQEDLTNYLQDTANSIKLIILNTLSSGEMDSERLENILSGRQDAELEQQIKGRFPEIKDFSFVITTAKIPDFLLYRQIRMIYDDFLTKQREVITASFGQKAESHIEAQLLFAELEKYGELLSKYPILLDYLALQKQ
ncbi:MAG: hypothetical protein LBU88_03575 [Treponema sp.]|jgi:hypothetical protein|nr:hypothetical protein [Treponema sp.]